MTMDTTTVFAIYGSVLATIVLVWDIIKYVRDRARIKVEVGHHVLLSGPGRAEHKLGIKMANVGKGTITIEASGFVFLPSLQNGNMVTINDPGLPKELGERQSHTSFVNASQIPENQVVHGWVRDATGHTWRSKKWPLRLKTSRK